MTAKNKPNEKQIFIYGLHTNKDETIRYVGKTTTLKKRLYEHINMSKRSKNHKNSWIKKHIDNGETIEIKIIEICHENNWPEREVYWIEQLKEKNNLTNIAEGGEIGNNGNKYKMTLQELKEKVKEFYPEIQSKTQWEKYFLGNKDKP